ncbi:MAG: hypothetical protein NVS2B7_28190 [Herpetosiphon sp.]
MQFYHDLPGMDIISPPTMPSVLHKSRKGHAAVPQLVVLAPKTVEVKAKAGGY